MKDSFYLLCISGALIMLSWHNFKESYDLLFDPAMNLNIKLSKKSRQILLIRMEGKVSILGLVYHIINTYLAFSLSVLLICLIIVKIIKQIFNLHFIWFSAGILYFSSFLLLGYSTVMVVIFGFLSWVSKRKRGL